MTSFGLASGWEFSHRKDQTLASGWSHDDEDGGRCRIRTCDFHRVKVALYR